MNHLSDITQIDGHVVPCVDIVVGGSPCQDLSVAGKRAGLAGERSGLFMEQIRIVKQMREEQIKNGLPADNIRPRFLVWENVPGALSSNNGEDFRCVLEEVSRIADPTVSIPRPAGGKWTNAGEIVADGWSVAWRIHDAQFWGKTVLDRYTGTVLQMGTPQRRRRIALVADFGSPDAGKRVFDEIPPVGEGVSGDIETCDEPGQGTAADAERGADAAIGVDCYNFAETGETAVSLNANSGQSANHAGPTVLQDVAFGYGQSGDPSFTLNGTEQHGVCHEAVVYDGSRRHDYQPLGEVSETVQAYYGGGENNTPIVTEPVVYDNHAQDSRYTETKGGAVQALTQQLGTGGNNTPLVCAGFYTRMKAEGQSYTEEKSPSLVIGTNPGYQNGVCIGIDRAEYNQGQNAQYNEELAQTLEAKGLGAVCIGNGQADQTGMHDVCGALNCMHDQQAFMTAVDCRDGYVVRRLTPKEAERLQGYPDNWSDIGEWIDSKGKKHASSDANRYRALGNSICLPYWQWMFDRIREAYPQDYTPTMASLFDGISGFPLVATRAGIKPVWSSEIDEFCIAVAKKHFPEEEKQ